MRPGVNVLLQRLQALEISVDLVASAGEPGVVNLRQTLVIDVQVVGGGRRRTQTGARAEAASDRRGEFDPGNAIEPVERLIDGGLQGLEFLSAAVAARLSQPLRCRLPIGASFFQSRLELGCHDRRLGLTL